MLPLLSTTRRRDRDVFVAEYLIGWSVRSRNLEIVFASLRPDCSYGPARCVQYNHVHIYADRVSSPGRLCERADS